MEDDQCDVSGQAQKHAGLEGNEEDFTCSTEIQGICFGLVLLALFGQGFAARPELVGLRRSIIIITSSEDAPDGESDDEDYEQSDWIGDLQVCEESLGARIGDPRQRGRGRARRCAEGGVHGGRAESCAGTPDKAGSSDCATEGRRLGGRGGGGEEEEIKKGTRERL